VRRIVRQQHSVRESEARRADQAPIGQLDTADSWGSCLVRVESRSRSLTPGETAVVWPTFRTQYPSYGAPKIAITGKAKLAGGRISREVNRRATGGCRSGPAEAVTLIRVSIGSSKGAVSAEFRCLPIQQRRLTARRSQKPTHNRLVAGSKPAGPISNSKRPKSAGASYSVCQQPTLLTRLELGRGGTRSRLSSFRAFWLAPATPSDPWPEDRVPLPRSSSHRARPPGQPPARRRLARKWPRSSST
jgi:hypothetical protein